MVDFYRDFRAKKNTPFGVDEFLIKEKKENITS